MEIYNIRMPWEMAGIFKHLRSHVRPFVQVVLAIFMAAECLQARAQQLRFSDFAFVNTPTTSYEAPWDDSPDVATDGNGNWIIVWDAGNQRVDLTNNDDILFIRSGDNGVTWSAPAKLNTNSASDAGNDEYARITTDKHGVWIACWYSNESFGGTLGTDDDILYARSLDNGATWSAPQPLNNNAATDGSRYDRYPEISTDESGVWCATWVSGTTGQNTEVRVSRSIDNGVSWSPYQFVSATSDYLRGPSIACDKQNRWIIAFVDDNELSGTLANGSYHVFLARSTNGGASWSSPAPLSTGLTVQIRNNGIGTWLATWRDEGNGFTAYSVNGGVTWSAPSAIPTGFYSLGCDATGRWIALGSGGGLAYNTLVVQYVESVNKGQTWSAIAQMPKGTGAPLFAPTRTAVGKAGRWIAVWDRPNESDQEGYLDTNVMRGSATLINAAGPAWVIYE